MLSLNVLIIMAVCYVAGATRVCPSACLYWHDRELSNVGPALAEIVCYHNMTCYHPADTPTDEPCLGRWKRCLRADDEESATTEVGALRL